MAQVVLLLLSWLQYKLYVSLGHCVVAEDPPEKDRLQLLNAVSRRLFLATKIM